MTKQHATPDFDDNSDVDDSLKGDKPQGASVTHLNIPANNYAESETTPPQSNLLSRAKDTLTSHKGIVAGVGLLVLGGIAATQINFEQVMVAAMSNDTLQADYTKTTWQRKAEQAQTSFQQTLSSQAAQMQNVQASIGDLWTAISTIQASQQSMNREISTTLQNQIASLSSQVATIEEDLINFAGQNYQPSGDGLPNSDQVLAILADISDIRASVNTLSGVVDNTATRQAEYDERFAQIDDVVTSLQTTLSEQAASSVEETAVPQNGISPWRLIAISAKGSVAFVKHSSTQSRLRLTLGTDVPGCGSVTNISASARTVVAGNCQIVR